MQTPDNHIKTAIDRRTLRGKSRLNEVVDRLSQLESVEQQFTPNPDFDTEAIEQLREHFLSHVENEIKKAIRETNWDDTPVLRIIEHHPDPTIARQHSPDRTTDNCMSRFSVRNPIIEIERFRDEVPPESTHATNAHISGVRTITKPLLDRLAEEYPELLDEVVE